MAIRIAATTKAEALDFDQVKLTDPALLKKLDGIACVSDSVLNYLDDVDLDATLSGGFLRLQFIAPKMLQLSIEIAADRKLARKELNELKQNLIGQVSDGIGSGAFDDLHASTDIAITFPESDKLKLTQSEGRVWLPRAGAAAAIEKKYGPLKRLVEKRDSGSARKKPAKRTSKTTKAKAPPKKSKPPNFRKLLRLLDKLERNNLYDEIKAEIDNVGGDLSLLTDGQLPYGNFREPKLLRLLLKAGLSPEIVDVDGHHLLWQAAVSDKSAALLLERGANINQADSSGETALMRAASLGRLKAVEYLLAQGADPLLKDGRGRTAIDHAKESYEATEEKVIAAIEQACGGA